MIVVIRPGAPEEEIQALIDSITAFGLRPHRLDGEVRTVIACIGDKRGKEQLAQFDAHPFVEAVVPIMQDYKLASREGHAERSILDISGVKIGGDEIVVMGGPCSVESEKQIVGIAKYVKACGGRLLRGGAYKPRTSPYAFQGLEEEGLKMLATARQETGLPVVTEIMDPHNLELVESYTDVLQVGARNIQNYVLLKELGRSRKPVLLKRGMSTLLNEFLMAAEYMLSEGNPNVMLCERGIRTFETATRNTLDLNAVPFLQEHSHLPVVVDPSHGVGVRRYVTPMALAGVAAGADAVIVETHSVPAEAWSDGAQTLNPEEFADLIRRLRPVAEAVGRTLPGADARD